MATGRGIADDLLANLAEDIETSEHVEALGRALGFSASAINRYTETNIKGDRVTCKGTRDMLFDWRQKLEPSYQHPRLKEALIKAELVMIADTHLKDTPAIQDIYKKKISESLSVKQCREKLKRRYLNSFCKIKMAPWDPNKYAEFKNMHTVVTVVKKDAYGRDTGKKEILQGSVDEIFSTEVNGTLPLRILISAPAGRGKTTAVAKMAYDWANRVQGSSLENLPLLFVVKLRNTGKQTSIAEAIRSQLLSDVTDLTQDGLHRFIQENQGICHILLDGLDEYAGLATNESLGSDIVDVMQWKAFPDCRVLVTTRPHLENFFNRGDLPRVYTKMCIEGFSQMSSREYIDRFFAWNSNPFERQGLKHYLDGQPLINELVITPLFCLMVCHLWSEGFLGSHTTTQTQLLDSVNVFLMHHANARSKSNYMITRDELRKTICKLGEIALAGLLDDAKKLVFKPSDFWRVPAILERACELGILSKTTTQLTGLPQSHETSSTTIEFYHKLAQEHSAAKYLANQTNKYLLRWKISKLDRVLEKIRVNIGDYENLLLFVAGTENRLCMRIMEVILDNCFLEESERQRILFDCSSEAKGTEQGVYSLVQRCIAAQRILLKSPSLYTVVGMQNLPGQLKKQVRQVTLKGSVIGFDVTNGLWSCLRSFSMLHTITILDSSLSFSQFPPELPSVTKLKAERVTSHSYEGLISSMPSLKEIDVTIDEVEGHTSQIRTFRPASQTGDQLHPIHIKLQALPSRFRDNRSESEKTYAELELLIREPTEDRQLLQVTGLKGQDEGALVNLFVRSTHLRSLNMNSNGCLSQNYDRRAIKECSFDMKYCQLSAVMTETLWFCLSYIFSLHQLSISNSSLRFPSSPPELQSVRSLKAKRVSSRCYEGLVSSIPGLKEIDVTIDDDVEGNRSQITTSRNASQIEDQLRPVHIKLQALPSRSRKNEEGKTIAELSLVIREQHTKNCHRLQVSGLKGQDEDALVNLFVKSTHLKSLDFKFSGSLNSNGSAFSIPALTIKDCKLTDQMTASMWSCLRSVTSLVELTISDSLLSFPLSPPELASVSKLVAKKVVSQSYEGLLTSLSGVKEIEVTIDDAERDITHITSGLCRSGGQQLTRIALEAPTSLQPKKKEVSRETMEKLGVLIRGTKNLEMLAVSGVNSGDEEDLVYLIECCRHAKALNCLLLLGCSSERGGRLEACAKDILISKEQLRVLVSNEMGKLTIEKCELSTEMTIWLWSSLRSFASLRQLFISDSSLSFPPSPPELTSVTKLIARNVTSQSYESLLSSLPGLKEIDITIDDAERGISQITAGLRRTRGQQLTNIRIEAPAPLPLEKKHVSSETMRGLGLLMREHINNLQSLSVSGVKSRNEDFVDLVKSSKALPSLHLKFLGCGSFDYGRYTKRSSTVTLCECQLSTEMTGCLWTCLRSYTTLATLTISDSSLSFPPSSPELTSVTSLNAAEVASQSYEGLLSTLPGLEKIDITFYDAERDVSQITEGLCRTGGQQLIHLKLHAPDSLPQEKKNVSRETMRGLGLLIREQTKNLRELWLREVKCTGEEDLVYLIECCRHVITMGCVALYMCGTKEGGRLEDLLRSANMLSASRDGFTLWVSHDGGGDYHPYCITHAG